MQPPSHRPDPLDAAISRVRDLGPAYAPYEKRLLALADRLSAGRFHLAVLGQFKRGKSTLLNALIGEDVLPSSVIPLTAVPTFILHGDGRSVRVCFLDEREDLVTRAESAGEMKQALLEYVAEDRNPGNEKRVSYVEITHPAPLLRDVVLIDTPGIGSTHRHNTEMTLNFLSRCDAALFMVSADPPITEAEVAFLREVQGTISRLFFLLNKVDYLTPEEQETAVSFLRGVLTAEIGGEVTIFPVSARTALRARQSGDDEAWRQSGLGAVLDHLVAFLVHEKQDVLREAMGRRAREILAELRFQIELALRAREIPLQDLEEKRRLFEATIREAEERRQEITDGVDGDRRRVTAFLEAEAERLRTAATARLEAVAADASPELDEKAAADALAAFIPDYFAGLLTETTAAVDRELGARLQRHRDRIDGLVDTVRREAAALFALPYPDRPKGEVYVIEREPFWVSRKHWSSVLSPVAADLLERALPRGMRERRVRERLSRQIESLVLHNVENLRWATLQNIDAAFRRFREDLDTDLDGAIQVTGGAIRAASERRQEEIEETAEEIGRLKRALAIVTESDQTTTR